MSCDLKHWVAHTTPTLVSGNEVLICSQVGVALYEGDEKTKYQEGKVSLSTFNLFYEWESKNPMTLRMPLQLIDDADVAPTKTARVLFSHAKVTVPVKGGSHYKLSFRKSGSDAFFGSLIEQLQRKAWRAEEASRVAATKPQAASSAPNRETGAASPPRESENAAGRSQNQRQQQDNAGWAVTDKAGIAGLMRASAESNQVSTETLRDIEDVMKNASAVVASIQQLKTKLKSGNSGDPSDEADASAVASIEATLGLGTVVREESLGKHGLFHNELSKELHAWMTHDMNKKTIGSLPVITLIELFSLYNKARGGTDLIAPGDLLIACRIMVEQKYSQYAMKEFGSGIFAMVNKNESVVISKLARILGKRIVNPESKRKGVVSTTGIIEEVHSLPSSSQQLAGANNLQIASLLNVAPEVANDLLEDLESSGVLCRSDAGFGCSTFYWNVFVF